jgi:multidrug efflux pump subunit AcrA (membrane-fusion protein)
VLKNRFLIVLIVVDLLAVVLFVVAWKASNASGRRSDGEVVPVVAVVEARPAAAAPEEATMEGVVVPGSVANVSALPSVEARVARVLVDAGARVRRGQVLAELDPTRQQESVERARAAVREAEARYELARRDPTLPEQLRQRQVGLERRAQEVREAAARLEALRAGAPSLEVAVAEEVVKAARARLELAASRHQDNKALYAKDLIARADVEESLTQWIVAESALAQARDKLALLKQGAPPPDLHVAEARLLQARLAQEADQHALARLRRGPRPEAIEAAAADLRQKRIRLREEVARLQQYRLRAPISGVVIARNINPGEVAARGAPRAEGEEPLANNPRSLFIIGDDTTVEFKAAADQKLYHGLRPGQPVTVESRALPGRTFPGKIARKTPRMGSEPAAGDQDGSTGSAGSSTFAVWSRVYNPNRLLVPGQVGVMRVRGAGAPVDPAALLLPRSALKTYSAGEGVVFVERNGTVRTRAIRFADGGAGTLRVLSGLSAGERVVVSDKSLLAENMSVQAVTTVPAAAL